MSSLVSSEFTALCQGQLSLLAQGVGASLSVVYLAEEWLGGSTSNWVPIAAYPEAAMDTSKNRPLQLPSSITLQTGVSLEDRGTHRALQPLYFNGHPIGLLVIAREGKRWQEGDYGQLEQVGYTLSAACALERRVQWLQARFHQQELLQEQQQDLLDNLIHQFRNPLTALRTFGKLLLRRISSEDANHSVAEGIVRESDRLQDLLQQINETVDEYGSLPATTGQPLAPSATSTSLTVPPVPTHPGNEEDFSEEIFEGDWEGKDAETTQTAITHSSSINPSSNTTPSALPPASPLTGEPLVVSSCQVLNILQPLLISFRAIALEKSQSVELHLPEEAIPPVLCDPKALREVLSNLLDNALKYGNPHGTVAVSFRQTTSSLTICISDDGPGIPPEDLPRLFERHYRGIQAQGPKPGTGLGLAIARTLVEQMGGNLSVVSPAGLWHPSSPAVVPTSSLESPGSAFLVCLEISPINSEAITTV